MKLYTDYAIIFFLSPHSIEEKYDIKFGEYFKVEKTTLEYFMKDGLLELPDNTITITEHGKDFVNLVCRIFDKFRRISVPETSLEIKSSIRK